MSLIVNKLSVSYGSTPILRDVTLDIETGERIAVMGPSGSGKSTLLRAIAGLTAIDAGTIHIDGKDLAAVPAHRRSVGLMFQNYALFPHMAVGENVAYGLRMAGIDRTERATRSGELLKLVGLEGFASRDPDTLSGGEQQRVALARTLAPGPNVVLLDEPLGSLDTSLRESLILETRLILASVGATSIYVTHDSTEAFSFADRVAVIESGRVVRFGTPSEIWHDPQSEFVARAIGQTNLVNLSAIGLGRHSCAYVPFDAISVDTAGSVRGFVISTRFEDGSPVLRVSVSNSDAELELPHAEALDVGTEIGIAIDANRVIPVSADQV